MRTIVSEAIGDDPPVPNDGSMQNHRQQYRYVQFSMKIGEYPSDVILKPILPFHVPRHLVAML